MDYQELEQLKQSREYKAAEAMETALNSMSWNPEKFAKSFTIWHRTLQQEFFRTIVATIQVAASEDYGFDLRNKGTHEIAKKIVDSGALDNYYLPFI